MSRTEELRDARKSYSVSYSNFIKICAKDPKVTVLFFEGKDIKYFGTRIRTLRPDLRWAHVDCGGKEKATRLYSLISNHETYSKKYVAFFLDTDYGLGDHPSDTAIIYYTPCYSIENLYISSEVFSNVLEGEFNLPRSPDEENCHKKSLDLYSTRLNEFLEAIRLLNAWTYTYRVHELKTGSGRLLEADTLSISKLVEIQIDNITHSYTVKDLENLAKLPSVSTSDELEAICKSYDQINAERVFRGKYISYFTRVFLTKFALCSKDGHSEFFPEAKKISLQVSEKNFLSDLSQYAETPPCLIKFILSIPPIGTVPMAAMA